MASRAALIERMRDMLQDPDDVAWSVRQKQDALQAKLDWLARKNLFTEIRGDEAVAEQGRYALPNNTIEVAAVAFDQAFLHMVSEQNLRYRREAWEESQRTPQYVTQDAQPMTTSPDDRPAKTFEVHPAPATTGPDIPIFPAVPLAQPLEGNFVVFSAEAPQMSDNDEAEVPVPEVAQTIAVYAACAELAGQPGDFRELGLQAFYDGIAALMLQAWEDHHG